MRKYAPLLLMLLALAGLTWAAHGAGRGARLPNPGAMRAAAPIPASDGGEALRRVQQLDRTVGLIDQGQQQSSGLAAPISSTSTSNAASTAGVAASAAPGAAAPASAARPPAPPRPAISMLYLSPSMQRVVINGQLLGEGDKLSGGGRVLSIMPDRVVVQTGARRQVLPVPEGQVIGTVAVDRAEPAR